MWFFFLYENIISKILYNAIFTNAFPIYYKSINNFPVFLEVLYKHKMRWFVEREQQIRNTHTNRPFCYLNKDSSWAVAFSFPILFLLTSSLPQETTKSLKHTYTHNHSFPAHSFHLSWVSSAVIVASSMGPRHPPHTHTPISSLSFSITAPAGSFALAGTVPASRDPAPSLWAVDSSQLFKSHLKSFPLGFILRSALHAKCFGTVCIKGVIGTNGTHKSIVLHLYDFR